MIVFGYTMGNTKFYPLESPVKLMWMMVYVYVFLMGVRTIFKIQKKFWPWDYFVTPRHFNTNENNKKLIKYLIQTKIWAIKNNLLQVVESLDHLKI